VFQKFNDNGELVATSTSAQPAAARVGAYGLGNSAETPDDDGAPLSVTQATVRVRAGLADAGDGGAPPDAAATAGEAGIEEVLVDARYDVYGAEEGVGLVVPLPLDVLEQVEEGDVLQVTTKFGLLQVRSMQCHVMSGNVMRCNIMPCHGMAWHGMAWHGMACKVISYHIISWEGGDQVRAAPGPFDAMYCHAM